MESQRVCTPTRNLTDRLGAPLGEAGSHGPEPRKEITSARNLQSRIEIPSGTKENATGSGGKRSALERLAEPSLRKAPSFESGRLQTRESLADEVHQSKQREEETRVQEPVRVSATLRLQDNNEGTSRRASRRYQLILKANRYKAKSIIATTVLRALSKLWLKENLLRDAQLLQLEEN
ncbi:hypothetical protein Bca4012_059935 [Brassica carinata]